MICVDKYYSKVKKKTETEAAGLWTLLKTWLVTCQFWLALNSGIKWKTWDLLVTCITMTWSHLCLVLPFKPGISGEVTVPCTLTDTLSLSLSPLCAHGSPLCASHSHQELHSDTAGSTAHLNNRVLQGAPTLCMCACVCTSPGQQCCRLITRPVRKHWRLHLRVGTQGSYWLALSIHADGQ